MAEYDAGSVFAQVIPSFRGVQQEIAKQAQKWGQTVQKTLSDSISQGITDGLGEGTRKSAPESKKDGDKLGKSFADSFKARVKAALASLPDAKIGADATPAEKRIAELRADLQRLSNAKIGVDLDANAATARIEFIRSELARLGAKSPNIQVKVDAGRAAAELAAVQAEADKLDGKKVNVGVSKSGVQSFREATSGASLLAASIIPLGALGAAALSPVAGAAVALSGGLLGAAAGAGVFAAVAIPAFSKVGDASKAQDALNNAIKQFGPNSQQAQSAAAKLQQQLALLTPAERTLNTAFGQSKVLFRDWQQAMEPIVIPVLTKALGLLAPVLGSLKPIVQGAADGFNRFLSYLGVVVTSPWFGQMAQMFGNLARIAIPLLGEAFVNLIQGFANLVSAFQPLIGPILRGFTNLTAKFKEWSASLSQSQGFKNFITFVQTNGPKLMSMLGAIGRAFVAIVKALAPIGAALIPVVTGIANFIASIPTWVLTAIAVGIAAIVAGFYAMSIAATVMEIAASPIILIIGGIIAALVALAAGIYFLVTNWTTVWNWIKAVAIAAWSVISGFFITAWNFLVAVWTAVWNTVVGVFVGIWNWIKTTAITVWTVISTWFMAALNAFLGFWSGIWNGIKNFFINTWNAVKGFFVGIWNTITAWFWGAVATFKALWNAQWNAMLDIFKGIWNWIKSTAVSIWNNISGFFTGAFHAFTGFFSDTWNGIVKKFSDIWGSVVGVAKSIWDKVSQAFKDGVNAVTGFINNHFIDPIDTILSKIGLGDHVIPLIPQWRAAGGPIYGPGGPTSDRVPVMASNGEFMMRTSAVQKYGLGFMHAVNSGKYAEGGLIGGVQHLSFGGSILDFGKNLWHGIEYGVKTVTDLFTKGPVKTLDEDIKPIVDAVQAMMPNGLIGDFGKGSINKMYEWVRTKVKEFFDSTQGGGNGGPGVQRWAPLVVQALAMLHQPASLLPAVLRRMNQESGGNPHAINLWDSNARAGHPSMGLMQTIPSTFNAYAGPFVGRGIWDPMANIYAGLNYAIHNYPSLAAAMNKPGGYAQGTPWVPEDQLAWLHKGEAVVPADVNAVLRSSWSGGGGAGQVNNFYSTYQTMATPEEYAAAMSRRTARAIRGLG